MDLGLSQKLATSYSQRFNHTLIIFFRWLRLPGCDRSIANKILPTTVKNQGPSLNIIAHSNKSQQPFSQAEDHEQCSYRDGDRFRRFSRAVFTVIGQISQTLHFRLSFHVRRGSRLYCSLFFCFLFFSTGPAFTVIYVLAGLPLARLADTRSRPFVLIFGVVFWSVMVLLTGFVESFWQLLVLRVFLGIGEVRTVRILFSQTFSNYSFPKHLRCRAAMTWLNFISYVYVNLCDDDMS